MNEFQSKEEPQLTLEFDHPYQEYADDPLMTVDEAAKYCRVSKTTINSLRRAGELPSIHITSDARYRRSDLNKLIDKHRYSGWKKDGTK